MATLRELQPRVEALKRRGLVVHSVYRRLALPRYLQVARDSDVQVMGNKDVHADATLCVVKLAWLEQLIAAADKVTNQENVSVDTNTTQETKEPTNDSSN